MTATDPFGKKGSTPITIANLIITECDTAPTSIAAPPRHRVLTRIPYHTDVGAPASGTAPFQEPFSLSHFTVLANEPVTMSFAAGTEPVTISRELKKRLPPAIRISIPTAIGNTRRTRWT